MSTLEKKLEEIEQKVKKLIEQNVQFKGICEDLLSVRRQLERENAELKKKLASQTQEVLTISEHTKHLKLVHQEDKEEIKKRINQYIQDIDSSIEWIKQL